MMRILLLLLLLSGQVWAETPLETAEVVLRPVTSGYSAEAIVEAGRESTLAAQVAGRILTLTVDAGDAGRRAPAKYRD